MNRMLAALVVLALAQAASAQTASNKPVPVAAAKDAKLNAAKPTFGTTKVAVMNLGYVFNNYDRAKSFKNELQAKVKNSTEEGKQLIQNLKVWQSAIQDGELSEAKKRQYEEKIITARRRLEDLERSMRAEMGKLQQDNLVILWKDIREAVKTFATDNDIELVTAYGDPTDEGLLDQFPNVNRKMQAADAGGSMPFFVAPRVDISEAIVELLNQRYREDKAVEDDPE